MLARPCAAGWPTGRGPRHAPNGAADAVILAVAALHAGTAVRRRPRGRPFPTPARGQISQSGGDRGHKPSTPQCPRH
jgi:hypothetical protein